MIQITRDRSSGEFQLTSEIRLAVSREPLFDFFADAFQLEAITPPWLRFRVLTPAPIEVQAGTLIDYQLRIHGIPVRWRTRICVWEPPLRFVDEQLRGPYRSWRHEHVFVEQDGKTLVRDEVRYRVPLGTLLHTLFVKRDVERIFGYRQQRLVELFPRADC